MTDCSNATSSSFATAAFAPLLSMSLSSPSPLAVQTRLRLTALPSDLLRYAADQFCSDGDAACLARANSTLFRTLVDYRMKQSLSLQDAAGLAEGVAARRATAAAASASVSVRLPSSSTNAADRMETEPTHAFSSNNSLAQSQDGDSHSDRSTRRIEAQRRTTRSSASHASRAHSTATSSPAMQRAKRKTSQRANAEEETGAESSAAAAAMDDGRASSSNSRREEEHASKKAKHTSESQQTTSTSGRPDLRFGLPVSVEQDTFESSDVPSLQTLAACRYSSLRTLVLEMESKQPIMLADFALPPTLQTLILQSRSSVEPAVLRVRESVDELRLPPSLTTLQMPLLAPIGANLFKQPRAALCPVAILPPSLLHLRLDWYSHWGPQSLPSSLLSLLLDRLKFEDQNRLPVWPLLPEGLQSLHFGYGVDVPLDGLTLPQILTRLDLSHSRLFNQPIAHLTLPAGLRSLRLSEPFKQPMEGMQLPPSLTELHFYSHGGFNRPIERLQLPPSLTSLRLSELFNRPCAALQLPTTLTDLRFGMVFRGPLPALPDSLRVLELSSRWRPTAEEEEKEEEEEEEEKAEEEAAESDKTEQMEEGAASSPTARLKLQLPAALATFTLPHGFPTPLRKTLLFAPNSALTDLSLRMELSAAALRGVDWPASLQSLELCGKECEPGFLSQVDWPQSLSDLTLQFDVKSELQSWTPPLSLTHLRLYPPPRDCSSVRWPPQLQRLTTCLAPISGPFHWPATLTAIKLNNAFMLSGIDLPPHFLPPTLHRLELPFCLTDRTPQLRLQLPQLTHLHSLEIPLPSGSHLMSPLADLLPILPQTLRSLSLWRLNPMSFFVTWPSPPPHITLPPSLTRLHLPSRRNLRLDGWQPLLNQRSNCSVTFEQEYGRPQRLDDPGDAWRMS